MTIYCRPRSTSNTLLKRKFDQFLHCFLFIYEFLDTSPGGEMDLCDSKETFTYGRFSAILYKGYFLTSCLLF